MTPDSPIKLVSELLDLPLIDSEGCFCGIVDDVEFAGTKELKLKALLVGPGAYEGRMPGWMFWLVRKIVGDRIIRIRLEMVHTIGAAVKLKCPARDLGLDQSEAAAGRWIPRRGAM
jgi:sporulation protein YlmC with PRC-barrel domain